MAVTLEDRNGNPIQALDLTGINIAGHTELEFSGLFAATQQFLGNGFPYNAGQGEHVKVLYPVDGGGFRTRPLRWHYPL